MVKRRDAGWYADPVAVGRARYWHDGWTDLIAWGGATLHDPTPLADVEQAETRGEADILSDYLESAVEYGVISSATAVQIRNDIEERVLGTPPPPRVMPPSPGKAPTPATELPGPTPPARHSVDLPPPGPVTTTPVRPQVPSPAAPIPVEPGRLAQWWHETRLVVRTDLAIHGLAYLGVLLLFAGVTGLIVFSFGVVAPWFRVLAEFLALGMIPEAHRPTPRVRDHRALVRHRQLVQQRITATKSKKILKLISKPR